MVRNISIAVDALPIVMELGVVAREIGGAKHRWVRVVVRFGFPGTHVPVFPKSFPGHQFPSVLNFGIVVYSLL